MQLLAPLRARRQPLLDLGRVAHLLPAGLGSLLGQLGRHLPEPGGQPELSVSYNDCCGKAQVSSASFCFTSKGERPGYRMGLYNDINWCMANKNTGYHCTVSVVVGLAE